MAMVMGLAWGYVMAHQRLALVSLVNISIFLADKFHAIYQFFNVLPI